jgi:hypothetical protein
MASALSGLQEGFAFKDKRLPGQGATGQRVKVGILVFANYLGAFRHGRRLQMENPG